VMVVGRPFSSPPIHRLQLCSTIQPTKGFSLQLPTHPQTAASLYNPTHQRIHPSVEKRIHPPVCSHQKLLTSLASLDPVPNHHHHCHSPNATSTIIIYLGTKEDDFRRCIMYSSASVGDLPSHGTKQSSVTARSKEIVTR
jgi:hypothetical protein